MKTKNIFKALALGMLMPAMMLTTACSNDDDIVNNTENTSKKGYAMPVTINVTRQGDEATTRATFDNDTKKLAFGTGDKLFVSGWKGTNNFAGTLTWQSDGTFSGTIYTKDSYSGTVDDLLAAADPKGAVLLPAGYETYGYLSVKGEGYGAYLHCDYSKTFALTKAAAVEQFSEERTNSYSSGFALAPVNAILNFTITNLSASTEVAVAFTKGSTTISGNVTTNASGTATFAVGLLAGGTDLKDYTLTVGGNAITLVSSSTELAAGKIYNITRSAAPATGRALSASVVGEVVGTDGLAYAVADKGNLPTDVTAAGMVAYKSGSNGLVIALADEASAINWSTANGASGAAAHTPAVTGQTWKLPSRDEWKQMFQANGSSESDSDGLNGAIIAAGGKALWQSYAYWSSTGHDSNSNFAYDVTISSTGAIHSYQVKTSNHRVRACLAF